MREHFGKIFSFASTRGISPWIRIQPLSAPKPLMKTNSASALAAQSPQNSRMTSANGAFESLSCEPGISRITAEHAMT